MILLGVLVEWVSSSPLGGDWYRFTTRPRMLQRLRVPEHVFDVYDMLPHNAT